MPFGGVRPGPRRPQIPGSRDSWADLDRVDIRGRIIDTDADDVYEVPAVRVHGSGPFPRIPPFRVPGLHVDLLGRSSILDGPQQFVTGGRGHGFAGSENRGFSSDRKGGGPNASRAYGRRKCDALF